MNYTDEKITKKPRLYYKQDFDVNNWEVIKKYLDELLEFPINSIFPLLKNWVLSKKIALKN